MRIMRTTFCLLICLVLLAGCQESTTTPADGTATAQAEIQAQVAATVNSLGVTATAIQAATDAVPTETPTITPTPDPFPTTVVGSIYVAEQRFEGGWMFWLQPNTQIWLLTLDDSGESIWSVYDDSFVQGQAESDPQIAPPEGRFQPIRGFGKLWRENPEVRKILGWALGLEQGHTTRYEYHQGGYVNQENEYVAEPGYHIVLSASSDTFRFNEASFTWQIDS